MSENAKITQSLLTTSNYDQTKIKAEFFDMMSNEAMESALRERVIQDAKDMEFLVSRLNGYQSAKEKNQDMHEFIKGFEDQKHDRSLADLKNFSSIKDLIHVHDTLLEGIYKKEIKIPYGRTFKNDNRGYVNESEFDKDYEESRKRENEVRKKKIKSPNRNVFGGQGPLPIPNHGESMLIDNANTTNEKLLSYSIREARKNVPEIVDLVLLHANLSKYQYEVEPNFELMSDEGIQRYKDLVSEYENSKTQENS